MYSEYSKIKNAHDDSQIHQILFKMCNFDSEMIENGAKCLQETPMIHMDGGG